MNPRSILRQPVLTIAIHARETRWTLGRAGRIRARGQVSLPPGLVDDGVVADAGALGLLLREARDFPGSRRMLVMVALPAQRCVVRQLELPPLGGKQFNEMVEREIRREMPMLGDNADVAWKRISATADHAVVLVVSLARDVVESHVAAIRAARLQPAAADLRIICAARALGAADGVIADVEDDEVELAIFRRGVPVVLRSVPMAAPCGEPAWSEQLAEELNRTIKFYRDSHRHDESFDGLPISLVGGAAQYVETTGAVASATGRLVMVPDAYATVERETDPRFAVNVGLALKAEAA